MKILVAIINHNNNKESIELKKAFGSLTSTCLIDSGSNIDLGDSHYFDVKLPNVYYCGMLNAIDSFIRDEEIVFIIASDVKVKDPEMLMFRMSEILAHDSIGIYAPSVNKEGSNHPQMRHKENRQLSKVPFVDGFCFAARTRIYRSVCPIDLSYNSIGWGVQNLFAYNALIMNQHCVVDHQSLVEHYVGPNNHKNPEQYLNEAKIQRKAWYSQIERKNQGFKTFRKMMYMSFFKNAFGAWLLSILIKRRLENKKS